jgi:hypothetical protein
MRNQRSCSDENDRSEQDRRDEECWHRHGAQLLGGSLPGADIFRRSPPYEEKWGNGCIFLLPF